MNKLITMTKSISTAQAVVFCALVASVAFTAHAIPERLWLKLSEQSPETIAGWITTIGLAIAALVAQARRNK